VQGHVRKRRAWEFIVDIGRHPVTGRRRQKSKSGFATKKEAESALHEFIRYVEGGRPGSGADQPRCLPGALARLPAGPEGSAPELLTHR
jgi:Arm DNA-binding domain